MLPGGADGAPFPVTAGTPAARRALCDVLAAGRELGFVGPGPVEPHLAHAMAFARVVTRACAVARACAGTDERSNARGLLETRRSRAGAPPAADAYRNKAVEASTSYATSPTTPVDGSDAVLEAEPPGPGWVLDLGSGGGLPGLVLALEWPQTTVTLLDAQQRRTAFLADAVRRLGVTTRVQVVEGRAESLGRGAELRGRVDVVVARAFGRPAVTAECAAPFLRADGILVVSEPPVNLRTGADPAPRAAAGRRAPGPELVVGGDDGEDAVAVPAQITQRWPDAGLAALGMGPASPVRDEFHFVVVRQLERCPERFPRRVGLPAKRPLF